MRYLILLLVLLLCFSCKKNLSSSVRTIETTVNHRINDIYFVNQNKGFAVGGSKFEEGYILKTIDGGQTWQKLQEPTEILLDSNETLQTLYAIDFLNENIGQVVGLSGRILRTVDGGDTWELILNGHFANFTAIQILDQQRSFISSYESSVKGDIFTSENEWYNFNLDSFSFALQDVFFLDDNFGFLAGLGSIQKTTDGGQSWYYTNAKNDFFYDIDFPTNQIGYACGWQGGLYKTEDQGENWYNTKSRNQVFLARQHYENIHFINQNTGAVCGYRGEILYTIDGAKTWQKLQTNTSENFHSIRFLNEKKLFVGGDNGLILEIGIP